VESCFLHELGPGRLPRVNPSGRRRIFGLVCPHAGYMYSGPVAAHSYLALAEDGVPATAIILGPNHTGVGSGVSLMTEGAWETPLGRVEIDSELAAKIQKASAIIDTDEEAHRHEHSLEVQLPFLQYLYQNSVKIVPICLMMQDLATAAEVGDAIAKAATPSTVIVASTDMTHYEPHAAAQTKDRKAIDAILALDDARLQETVESKGITMCGHGPVASTIVASKILGAKSARFLGYSTSGDITGDQGAVVGYLAASFHK